MPVDLRKIVFSNAEVQAALVNYCMRHKTKMPETGIARVVVNWEMAITTDIHFIAVDGKGEGEVLSFSNEEVAVALILYCHLFKDPLPHDAMKTLDPAGEGVVLSLRHAWGEMVHKDHPGYTIAWMSADESADETQAEGNAEGQDPG